MTTTTTAYPEIDQDKAPDVVRLVQRLGALPEALLGRFVNFIDDEGVEAGIKCLLQQGKHKALAYLAADAQERSDASIGESFGYDLRVVVILDGERAFHPTAEIAKLCRRAADDHSDPGAFFLPCVSGHKDEVSP